MPVRSIRFGSDSTGSRTYRPLSSRTRISVPASMPSDLGSRTATELPDLNVFVVFIAASCIYRLYIHPLPGRSRHHAEAQRLDRRRAGRREQQLAVEPAALAAPLETPRQRPGGGDRRVGGAFADLALEARQL